MGVLLAGLVDDTDDEIHRIKAGRQIKIKKLIKKLFNHVPVEIFASAIDGNGLSGKRLALLGTN